MKHFSKITAEDLQRHPVWEFANDAESSGRDELWLRPVRHLPIDDFGNRIVGTTGTLANGSRVPIILQNVDLQSPYRTEHLVTLTVFNDDGETFPLARYHDVGIDTYGPDELAAFLGIRVEDIFPISYDISDITVGEHDSVRREIRVRPRRPLSESEIIEMVVGSLSHRSSEHLHD